MNSGLLGVLKPGKGDVRLLGWVCSNEMSKLLKEKSNNQCAEWSRKFFAAVLDCPVPEFTDYIKDNEATPAPTHNRARAHTHTPRTF